MKWRIKKVSGKWWGVFPPSWRFDAHASYTFEEAVRKLVELQSTCSWERGR